MTDDLIPAVVIVESGVLDLDVGLHVKPWMSATTSAFSSQWHRLALTVDSLVSTFGNFDLGTKADSLCKYA